MSETIRVLIAKPGLDGHDRGALVVAQGLRDEGMEVIYTGLRQTPKQIVAVAIQEDAACIGLSSLSGAHLTLFPEVVRELKAAGADDILVIGGGVIPTEDIAVLKGAGVAEVFTPGSTIADMAAYIRTHAKLRDYTDWHPSDNLDSPLHLDAVDHIGIAVTNTEEALVFYTKAFGLVATHVEEIADQGVKATFLTIGEMAIELLEPTTPDSPVAKFLQTRGAGMHHIAYRVPDIQQALSAAKMKGIRLIDEQPRRGGHGKLIAFIHPKESAGVLTELCQRVEVEE